jgi:hypothetical protein
MTTFYNICGIYEIHRLGETCANIKVSLHFRVAVPLFPKINLGYIFTLITSKTTKGAQGDG